MRCAGSALARSLARGIGGRLLPGIAIMFPFVLIPNLLKLKMEARSAGSPRRSISRYPNDRARICADCVAHAFLVCGLRSGDLQVATARRRRAAAANF